MSDSDEKIKIDGMRQASELLSGVDETTRSRILHEISIQNPALAEKLKKNMVQIETVLNLPAVDLAKVIEGKPDLFIATTLRGLPPEIQSTFFSNISKRRGDEIKEILESMGPKKLADVKLAQDQLIEIAQKLFDDGKISTRLTKA